MYDFLDTYTVAAPSKPARKAGQLTRMNLLVNREHLQRLKDIYGLKSESEAVRKAAELVLLADEALEVVRKYGPEGGPIDVHHRLDGGHPLPAEWPEDEPIDFDEDPELKPARHSKHRR